MTTVPIPFVPRSNIVFSADGSRLFVRSTEDDLWSVAVAGHPSASEPRVERVLSREQGRALAAGWVGGRLAVASLMGRDLRLTHARPSPADPQVLEPVLVEGAAPRFEGAPADRLDPYAIVWGEATPYEGGVLTGMALLRDGAGALVAVAAAGEGAPSLEALARDVTCLGVYEQAPRALAFVGCLPPPSGVATRRFWRRPPAPAPAFAEMSRRGGWSPQVSRWLAGEASPRAVAGYRGGAAGFGLVAFERAARKWTVAWEWGERDIAVPDAHDVVGVLGGDDEPSLLARTATGLWRVSADGVAERIAELPAGFAAIACSLAEPLVAWTTPGHVHFARPR